MQQHIENKYMDIDEAAQYLKVKKSWLYQNHKLLDIPSYSFGRNLRFKSGELDAWAQSKYKNQAS